MSVPTRKLPSNPDLRQLKRQARELRAAFLKKSPEAVTEINTHFRNADPSAFTLHQAQLVIARAYGFDSWRQLKLRVDGTNIQALFDAVEISDVETAGSILSRRPELADLECPGRGELRCLHIAAMAGALPMVRLLLLHDVDPAIGIWPHRDATSAIQLASDRGYDELVRTMSEQRPQIEKAQDVFALVDAGRMQDAVQALDSPSTIAVTVNDKGWTLLHSAVVHGAVELAEHLLKLGVDVNIRSNGATALELAATEASPNFAEMAAVLIAHGATVSDVAAVALGDAQTIQRLSDEGKLYAPVSLTLQQPFRGLLTTAVRHRRGEIVKLLLQMGLDPDERVRVTGSDDVELSAGMPLYYCAGTGQIDLARSLLEAGADPNAQIVASGTPVGHAYGVRDLAMLDLLVTHGGVVYAANAGYYRDVDLSVTLLEAEVAGTLPAGVIPADTTVAESLLESAATGGDPWIVNMALDRVSWPRDDIRWYWRLWDTLVFWNHRPGIPTADPSFDRGTYLACFKAILSRCSVNIRPQRFGQNILHEIAAMGRHVSDEEVNGFAQVALDAGVSITDRDDLLCSTPLGWACRWGRGDLVRLLLSRGAPVSEPDAVEWAQPLSWASRYQQLDVAGLLRSAADPASE